MNVLHISLKNTIRLEVKMSKVKATVDFIREL